VVGKSLAAGRDDRYFGLVRSQDEQPGRRFREVLRSQSLPVTQPVTMLTDGGDSVRALAGELSPGAVRTRCEINALIDTRRGTELRGSQGISLK
jgi:hypothetical protein